MGTNSIPLKALRSNGIYLFPYFYNTYILKHFDFDFNCRVLLFPAQTLQRVSWEADTHRWHFVAASLHRPLQLTDWQAQLSHPPGGEWNALIGRAPTLLRSHWSRGVLPVGPLDQALIGPLLSGQQPQGLWKDSKYFHFFCHHHHLTFLDDGERRAIIDDGVTVVVSVHHPVVRLRASVARN